MKGSIYETRKRIISCVLIVCAESETKHILVLEGVVMGMHIPYILDIIIDYRKEKNMDNSNWIVRKKFIVL